MIRAVTFDYWNTLVATPGDDLIRVRADHWSQVLSDAGHQVSHEQLGEAFQASWASFQEAWKENRQYQTPDAVRRVLEVLDLAGEEELAEVLVQDYEAGKVESDLQPTPNIGSALEGLKAAGVKVGIICDVGMTPSVALRGVLERFGLLQHFDHHSFSDDVGTYKPDPRIFAHALEGLGSSPDETAHVGDLRRTDVAGARAMGMVSVRYAGVADDVSDAPDGDVVCDSHDALPELLLSD